MQPGDVAEEQTVLRHGVINTRSRQDQTVVAAKARQQDGNGHQSPAKRAEHLRHHRRGHPIFGCILDSTLQHGSPMRTAIQGKHIQVNEVASDV